MMSGSALESRATPSTNPNLAASETLRGGSDTASRRRAFVWDRAIGAIDSSSTRYGGPESRPSRCPDDAGNEALQTSESRLTSGSKGEEDGEPPCFQKRLPRLCGEHPVVAEELTEDHC